MPARPQYVSLILGERCRDAGIPLSMGSKGDAYDNAVAESFFASLGSINAPHLSPFSGVSAGRIAVRR